MMIINQAYFAAAAVLLLAACKPVEAPDDELTAAVDEVFKQVLVAFGDYELVTTIDHARLAAEAGEPMPPARVAIFSEPTVNTPLLLEEPLIGLDLPFRVLAYAEGNTPAVTYTSAAFLRQRYGLQAGSALASFEDALAKRLEQLPANLVRKPDLEGLAEGAGRVALDSPFGFDETVKRVKAAVMEEGDTIWFGDIDYKAEAAELGFSLPRLTLLLWGAPEPGGKAMRDFPRMGLDAFCQKTLIHETAEGTVTVHYNDMPTFAQMHYGQAALPHRMIARRMRATLEGAISER